MNVNAIINLICASGANIRHMEILLENKYVSKKQLRKAIKKQSEYLETIESIIKKYSCENS